MTPDKIISELKYNIDIFEILLKDLSNELIYWKPKDNSWCILEIVCHLIDIEKEDFRKRVFHLLENPGSPPPVVESKNWPTERKYLEQSFPLKLEEFMHERNISVVGLLAFHSPDWNNSYQHTKWGTLSSKFFLNNWLAHDYLHIRQITKLKYQYLIASEKFDFEYAGEWN